jgi:hypothetical protein
MMLWKHGLLPLIAALFLATPAAGGTLDDLHRFIAMGPDPGGKSGEGVTPSTTTTDHPAAPGPQSEEPSAKRDRDDAKQDSVRREGGSERREDQPAKNQGSSHN